MTEGSGDLTVRVIVVTEKYRKGRECTDHCRVHTQGRLAVLIWTIGRGRESKSLSTTRSAGNKG